ncbi:CRISPR-associated protein Cas4 [Candidatus Woesearchaeota archaeon]|nr:CRISPR-associated protein Cas4 [Candidatus Woesearchaeota archaeon]
MIYVTALSDYLYCPRKLFLAKRLGFVEPPKQALIFGSVKHEVMDQINKSEEEIVGSVTKDYSLQEITSVYKKKYYQLLINSLRSRKFMLKKLNIDPLLIFREAWPFFQREASFRAENLQSFIQEKKVYGKELWDALTPKLLTEFAVRSESLSLCGVIDRVEINQGLFTPVELKTGKAPKEGLWPNHRIQIAAYMLLLQDCQKKVNEGVVHYLDTNQRVKIVMNPFIQEEVIELIKKVNGLLSGHTLPKICEETKKCASCGLREQCFSLKGDC